MLGCKRRRRKAERPTEILAAAFDTFAAHGFAGTRLEDVAALAGVTKGTIYVYFDSKEDLFVAALREMTSPALDHLRTLMAGTPGTAADVLRQQFLFMADHTLGDRRKREVIRLLVADGPRFPALVDRWHAEIVAPACEAFSSVVAYGIERGEFRPGAAADFPQMFLAPIVMANVWLSIFGERHPIDLRQFFAAAVDTLIDGLAMPPVRPDLVA